MAKAIICPTVLANDEPDYATQMRTAAGLSKRIQIDLMDGEFASPGSIGLDQVWWPAGVTADIHLMYRRPMDYLEQLLHLKPHMVIIHAEAIFHHMHFAAEMHKEGINAGLAILPDTPVANIDQILSSFDHLLIFSGDLGKFGGRADLKLLNKVQEAKQLHPGLEFGWDGGVNNQNVRELAEGGIEVINAGGYIQQAEDPANAYNTLVEITA